MFEFEIKYLFLGSSYWYNSIEKCPFSISELAIEQRFKHGFWGNIFFYILTTYFAIVERMVCSLTSLNINRRLNAPYYLITFKTSMFFLTTRTIPLSSIWSFAFTSVDFHIDNFLVSSQSWATWRCSSAFSPVYCRSYFEARIAFCGLSIFSSRFGPSV